MKGEFVAVKRKKKQQQKKHKRSEFFSFLS